MTQYEDDINEFVEWAWSIPNDTTYEQWGMLTHDDRYKARTGETANMIQRENNLDNDQAYYFLYTMTITHMTYEEAKAELLSSKDFEDYVKNKRLARGEI